MNHKNNEKVIYDNLATVVDGEDIKVALKKMKRNTVWLRYSIDRCYGCNYLFEDCLDCKEGDLIFEVKFTIKGHRLVYYTYPRIFYNSRTNKVLGTDDGMAPF